MTYKIEVWRMRTNEEGNSRVDTKVYEQEIEDLQVPQLIVYINRQGQLSRVLEEAMSIGQ